MKGFSGPALRIIAIIHARMGSSRLPGKVLLDIGGQPMLVRVVERACRARRLDGVMDRVTFPGFISNNDLPRFYHMADLYISASHVDGLSVSLMEALACGLPCIVSDIPANREWVTDGVNVLIFPDGDVDALAGIISKAIVKHKCLTHISKNARKTAEEKANWKGNFNKLIEAYNQAVTLS